ncbi:putative Protein prenyltransferase alpha subunit repeat [Trypanosoma vivax]|nr:putative Protein prenyltransferase alpha subunit repeat [Trypanosoma vivax]
MHDQRKIKRHDVSEKAREQRLAEVQEFTTLYDSLLDQRRRRDYSVSVLPRLTDLLMQNAEAYTMYGYRREVLLHLWSDARRGSGSEIKEKASEGGVETEVSRNAREMSDGQEPLKKEVNWLEEELRLSSTILKKDYKVYAAFVHRRWIFTQLRRLAGDVLAASVGPQLSGSSTFIDSKDRASSSGVDVGCVNHESNERQLDAPISEEVRFYASALQKEKRQCDALLALDERNFHAWEFRRWVMKQLLLMEELLEKYGVKLDHPVPRSSPLKACFSSPGACADHENEPPRHSQRPQGTGSKESRGRDLLFAPHEQKEIHFTTAMIRRNFSNYSAWHQRGFILQGAIQRLERMADGTGNSSVGLGALSQAWDQLGEDLTLLTTAIYCDPSDQSAWYYAQFIMQAADLLQRLPFALPTPPIDVNAQLNEVCVTLAEEERRLNEDTETYWPYLHLFNTLRTIVLNNNGETTCEAALSLARVVRTALQPHKPRENDEDDCWNCLEELATHLMATDPLRSGMYRSLLRSVLPTTCLQ